MKKVYVLDTNVLIHDPDCIHKFEEHDVVIPVCCLEELDKFKNESSERGFHARGFSRELGKLIDKYGSLNDYVPLENGGRLKIYSDNVDFSFAGLSNSYDNLIIAIAKMLCPNGVCDWEVILVSNDINMRVKAASVGVRVSEYKNDTINDANKIGRPVEIDLDYSSMSTLYSQASCIDATYFDYGIEPYENMPVIAKSPSSGKQSALCFWRAGKLVRFQQRDIVTGISTRGAEQAFLMAMLLDPEIDLVVCAGEGGSGKTILSLAAGLDMIRTSKKIDRIMFTKSIVPVGEDIGYVPGTKEEKMAEWIKPMYDNMELLMRKTGAKASEYFEKGLIEVDALTYIRGRSLMNRFVVLDECFPYDQTIATEDGSTKIGTIYSNYIRGVDLPSVKTFNEETGEFEYNKVLSASHKGIRQLVAVKSGKKKIKCTDNHPFLTTNGWIKAIDLKAGDYLLINGDCTRNSKWLNDDQLQVAMASYLGDGCISKISNGSYRIQFIHGERQKEYLEFKASIFGRSDDIRIVENNGYSAKTAFAFNTTTIGLPFNPEDGDFSLNYVLSNIDERGLAIWFMDDGSCFTSKNGCRLHTESFSLDENNIICSVLNERFNLFASVREYIKNDRVYYYIVLSSVGFSNLCKLIGKYIHPVLKYKIHIDYADVTPYKWNNQYAKYCVSAVNCVELTDEYKHVFDIEVDKNHNFIACFGTTNDGFIVHNCQNLAPSMARTIVTRIGDSSKLVLLGDLSQIDSPYLNKTNNALIHAITNMHGLPNVGVLRMSKTQRSRLAQQAIDRL